MSALIYIGKGAFLPNVPARDLSRAEVKECGGEKFLLESGLYKKPPARRKPASKKKEGE